MDLREDRESQKQTKAQAGSWLLTCVQTLILWDCQALSHHHEDTSADRLTGILTLFPGSDNLIHLVLMSSGTKRESERACELADSHALTSSSRRLSFGWRGKSGKVVWIGYNLG